MDPALAQTLGAPERTGSAKVVEPSLNAGRKRPPNNKRPLIKSTIITTSLSSSNLLPFLLSLVRITHQLNPTSHTSPSLPKCPTTPSPTSPSTRMKPTATGSSSRTTSTISRASLPPSPPPPQGAKTPFPPKLTFAPSTDFLSEHPGGDRVLKRFAGKNATKAFWKYHGESVLKKYGDKFKIGSVDEAAKL